MDYASATSLVEALQSSLPAINLLGLDVLHKASTNSSDAAIVAGLKDLTTALVRLWLMTSEVDVAQSASRVVEGLLRVDLPSNSAMQGGPDIDMDADLDDPSGDGNGQGLMWRRMFEDKDIYALLYQLNNLRMVGRAGGQPTKKQTTLAQSRLLGMLPSLAEMDFNSISRSHFPDVERSYGLEDGEGLLDYAAGLMVDIDDDLLMHMTLIDFFNDLIQKRPIPSAGSMTASQFAAPNSSVTLDFLIRKRLHRRTLRFYLQAGSQRVDALSASFLGGSSATYLATYSLFYPEHLLSSSLTDDGTLVITEALQKASDSLGSANGRGGVPLPQNHDLQALISLPRVALVAGTADGRVLSQSQWLSSPVSKMPYMSPDSNCLKALAAVFHGPPTTTMIVGQPPSSQTGQAEESLPKALGDDAAAARALYLLYLDQNPQLYKQVVGYAETVALKEIALAAIGFLAAIITAEWAPLPVGPTESQPRFSLPAEEQLQSTLRTTPPSNVPSTGIDALLSSPAVDTALPYLCSPPKTFTNLVGGRGDVESAAYQIAAAKYDALKLLHRGMQKESLRGTLFDIVSDAVARGPWGAPGGVGGSIGTLEL